MVEDWSDECIQALRQTAEVRRKRGGTALVSMMDESSDPQADVADLLLTLRHASPLGSEQQPDAHNHAHGNGISHVFSLIIFSKFCPVLNQATVLC